MPDLCFLLCAFKFFPLVHPLMPRPNVLLVQRIYDAFRRRDVDKILSLYDPDIEISQSAEIPWGGEYRGHAGARQFIAALTQHITSAVTFEQIIDAGDRVAVIGRTKGTVNITGAAFDVPIVHLWELRNGLAVRAMYNIDNPTMLEALHAP